MMQQVTSLIPARHGPEKQPQVPKTFIAIDELPNNPWTLCRPEFSDTILVTYGFVTKIARMLTARMTPDERYWVIEQRRMHRYPDGRAFSVHLHTMRSNNAVVGGKIWLKNGKGNTVTIHDVKGMFQLTWRKVKRLYGCDDLADIMTRTRSSLAAVGITPYHQDWYRCASITDKLWRDLDIDLSNVPALAAQKGPGNLQGYRVFGHTDAPVYSYDINSAYLSVMAEFPALQPFTDYVWSARQELRQANDPAAHLLKLAATIMPGKFTSNLPGNKFYRPVLGHYIRQRTNDRLTEAMGIANSIEAPTWQNVFRYCVDGFIAFSDISTRLDIGDALGQWKPVKRHKHLSIAKTNVWYTDREYKDGGFTVAEQQIVDDPFEIHTTRTIFDWDRLEERVQPVTLHQPHEESACRKCWEEDGRELHDRF